MMLAVSRTLTMIFLLLRAIAEMAIGALSGWLFSLITRRGSHAVLRDAFPGLFGYFAAFVGCIFAFPRNTVINPEWVAVGGAVLLPLLNELYRWRRRKPASLA
jgi:uncharacterized membrane protein YeaQ/YmgE (transglycosylase-associated protein family)